MDTRMLLLLWERAVWQRVTLSTACRDSAGVEAWLGASQAPGTTVLTPRQAVGILCWSWHGTGVWQDVPAACREVGMGIGKGQGDAEVLEKRLIIPIAPEEREMQKN